MKEKLWEAPSIKKKNSLLSNYELFISKRFKKNFNQKYENILKCSIKSIGNFWSSIWDFLEIKGFKSKLKIKKSKYFIKINFYQIHSIKIDPNKEARFKVTRPSNYGERYKLFVIKKNTLETGYNLEQYGISLVRDKNIVIVDTLQRNGKAKKDDFETDDYISEFKIENVDSPNKGIIYPIPILSLIIFGYLNSRKKE